MDTLKFFGTDRVTNSVNHPLGTYQVGEFCYYEAGSARTNTLNRYSCAHSEAASSGLVGLPKRLGHKCNGAGWEIRTRNVFH